LIDLELKHLFKGKSGWVIKKLNEDEYLLDFPTEDLRNELIMFKGFEFATAIARAKVEPTNLEREIVCALKETWVKATCFPRKSKREMVIKEIAHLVGDPVEVDERNLKSEGAIRVKVLCKNALNSKGNTMVFINKQGHLIRWRSEKLRADEGDESLGDNNSKFDKDKEGSDEEGDSEESDGSHDSGFARLAKEQREEEKKRKLMGKSGGTSQAEEMDWETMVDAEIIMS
jgi:hypothetical protein